jgi:hypothetical protein
VLLSTEEEDGVPVAHRWLLLLRRYAGGSVVVDFIIVVAVAAITRDMGCMLKQ